MNSVRFEGFLKYLEAPRRCARCLSVGASEELNIATGTPSQRVLDRIRSRTSKPDLRGKFRSRTTRSGHGSNLESISSSILIASSPSRAIIRSDFTSFHASASRTSRISAGLSSTRTISTCRVVAAEGAVSGRRNANGAVSRSGVLKCVDASGAPRKIVLSPAIGFGKAGLMPVSCNKQLCPATQTVDWLMRFQASDFSTICCASLMMASRC
jgi:hypothetical protein